VPVRSPSRFQPGEFAERDHGSDNRPESGLCRRNTTEDVMAEIGLVLVIILGAIAAMNTVLLSLHVVP
jgi:hypothetical protein